MTLEEANHALLHRLRTRIPHRHRNVPRLRAAAVGGHAPLAPLRPTETADRGRHGTGRASRHPDQGTAGRSRNSGRHPARVGGLSLRAHRGWVRQTAYPGTGGIGGASPGNPGYAAGDPARRERRCEKDNRSSPRLPSGLRSSAWQPGSLYYGSRNDGTDPPRRMDPCTRNSHFF
jgi:hypothetical protein